MLLWNEKRGGLIQSYDKNPPIAVYKKPNNKKKVRKMLDYTTIAIRLGTLSWIDGS